MLQVERRRSGRTGDKYGMLRYFVRGGFKGIFGRLRAPATCLELRALPIYEVALVMPPARAGARKAVRGVPSSCPQTGAVLGRLREGQRSGAWVSC